MDPKPFSELEEAMPLAARKRAHDKAQRILSEIRLQELRKKRGLTQEQTAQILNVRQNYISKLERQQDCSLSKFRQYVEALGGKAEIFVYFPNDETVQIPL